MCEKIHDLANNQSIWLCQPNFPEMIFPTLNNTFLNHKTLNNFKNCFFCEATAFPHVDYPFESKLIDAKLLWTQYKAPTFDNSIESFLDQMRKTPLQLKGHHTAPVVGDQYALFLCMVSVVVNGLGHQGRDLVKVGVHDFVLLHLGGVAVPGQRYSQAPVLVGGKEIGHQRIPQVEVVGPTMDEGDELAVGWAFEEDLV